MEVVGGHCPHCGAALDLSLAAREVRCSYCGKVSVVRPRAEPTPRPPPEQRPLAPQRPTLDQPAPRSAAPAAIAALLVVVGASIAAFLAMRKASSTNGAPSSRPASAASSAKAAPSAPPTGRVERGVRESFARASRPFVVDLDGDRVSDLVLRNGEELLAYSGATGKKLWSAPTPTKGWPSFALVRDGRALYVSEVGLTAFDGKTGKKLFAATLPDRPELPCTAPAGKARLLMGDDTVAVIELEGGALTTEKRGAPCAEHTSDTMRGGSVRRRLFPVSFLPAELGALACGGVKVSGTYDYVYADPCLPALGLREDELGELSLRAVAPLGAGPRAGHVLFGTKRRGKRAAMVGVARGRKLVWAAVASPVDAADLPEEGPERSALDGAHVAMAYGTLAGANLAVFELETGRRVADVPLGGKPLHVVGLGGRFGVVLDERIVAVDPTGKVKTLVE
jgi:DNA-directed RNA polymerase subunit RPC12/RpoP